MGLTYSLAFLIASMFLLVTGIIMIVNRKRENEPSTRDILALSIALFGLLGAVVAVVDVVDILTSA